MDDKLDVNALEYFDDPFDVSEVALVTSPNEPFDVSEKLNPFIISEQLHKNSVGGNYIAKLIGSIGIK